MGRAFIIGWIFGKLFPRLAIAVVVMIIAAWFLVASTFLYVSKTGLLMKKGHSSQKNEFIKKQ